MEGDHLKIATLIIHLQIYSDNADDEYDDDYSDSYDTREYPDERSSPREHDVSGYDRQQNGKTVHVNPYKRGSRHNEE